MFLQSTLEKESAAVKPMGIPVVISAEKRKQEISPETKACSQGLSELYLRI